jgi:hypothetical protein
VGRSTTVAIAGLLAVAGCSGGDGDAASPSAPPPVPASARVPASPGPDDAARTAALAQYERYIAYQTEIEGGTPLDETRLADLASGRAVALIRRIAADTARDGITVHGPTGPRTPRDVTVSLTATVPTVMLTACIDVSERRATYRDGTPVPRSSQAPRYVRAYTVTRDPAGTWRVADMDAQRDRPC